MAARYRKIDPRVWDDESFMELSKDAKLVAFYMITAQSNRCGIFRFSPALGAEHCGMDFDTYRIAMGQVLEKLGWKYDAVRRVLYIPTWFKYNEAQNAKHLAGCLRDVHDVPKTDLLKLFWENKRHIFEGYRETFDAIADTYAHTYANTYTHTSTVTEAGVGAGVGEGAREGAEAESSNAGALFPDAAADEKSKRKGAQKPVDESPVILTVPCTGKLETWELRQSKLDEYQQTFPELDVLAAIRAARQWIIDNRRKTHKGTPAFLTNWLNNSQNRRQFVKGAPSAQQSSNGARGTPTQQRNREAIDRVFREGDAE
jgi:hypothetical protein